MKVSKDFINLKFCIEVEKTYEIVEMKGTKFLVDEYSNKITLTNCSKEMAIKKLQSLINCKDCIDCVDCIDCESCVNCIDCVDCNNCFSCIDCRYCIDCSSCGNIIACEDSGYLKNCMNAVNETSAQNVSFNSYMGEFDNE